MVTAPVELRDDLTQPDPRRAHRPLCPTARHGIHAAHKTAMAAVARRVHHLDDEIAALEDQIRPIVETAAPQLLDEVGISHVTAGGSSSLGPTRAVPQ